MNSETPTPLPRNQVLIGAAMAVLTALAGFWLTWGRLHEQGPAGRIETPDRRLAESGRVARPDSTVPRLGPGSGHERTYIPHAGTASAPPSLGSAAFPDRCAAAPTPNPSTDSPPQPDSSTPATPPEATESSPTGLVVGTAAPGWRPAPRPVPARPRSQPAPPPPPPAPFPTPQAPPPPPPRSQPASRRYPDGGEAREETSLPRAWARAGNSWGLLVGGTQRPEGSVTLLPGGLAVGSLVAYNHTGRWNLQGPFQLLERVADDNPLGLVLLRAEGGVPLPLASAPPRAGTELAAAPGFAEGQAFQPCVVTERLADGLFLFRGNILPSSAGAALVNRRAELVGVVLGRPEGYPGHDYNVAADSSILLELSEQGRATSRRGPGGTGVVNALLARDVRSVPLQRSGRTNARVVPGTALGDFRIGNSRQEVEGVLGPGRSWKQGRGFETLSYPVYSLEFTLLSDQVVALTTTDPFYATSKGVGVGTRWSDIRPTAELAEVRLGPLPGAGQLALAPGLELELDWEGRIQRLRVTPR